MAKIYNPTSQLAAVRPIAFALQSFGSLSKPITLKIRPEDLTRTEPSRLTVHQTLGRAPDPNGWVDNFGESLPTLTIAGHTGWRAVKDGGEDGAAAFEALNKLVHHDYHAAKQQAIDFGVDPATVKLIYIDMLDNFTWSVAPTSFVLRRSKSRALLFQYNIVMQAVSTSIDDVFSLEDLLGKATSLSAGVASLNKAAANLAKLSKQTENWVTKAASLASIGAIIRRFVDMSYGVFSLVTSSIATAKNAFNSVTSNLIGMAGDIAKVGANVMRTISAIANIPADVKHGLMQVGAAFNEAACVLRNSLKPQASYQEYDGLFGASNCSSTTGGRSTSPYAESNVFQKMQAAQAPVSVSSSSQSSIGALGRNDPVLQPMPIQEISRHVNEINSGVQFT